MILQRMEQKHYFCDFLNRFFSIFLQVRVVVTDSTGSTQPEVHQKTRSKLSATWKLRVEVGL